MEPKLKSARCCCSADKSRTSPGLAVSRCHHKLIADQEAVTISGFVLRHCHFQKHHVGSTMSASFMTPDDFPCLNWRSKKFSKNEGGVQTSGYIHLLSESPNTEATFIWKSNNILWMNQTTNTVMIFLPWPRRLRTSIRTTQVLCRTMVMSVVSARVLLLHWQCPYFHWNLLNSEKRKQDVVKCEHWHHNPCEYISTLPSELDKKPHQSSFNHSSN